MNDGPCSHGVALFDPAYYDVRWWVCLTTIVQNLFVNAQIPCCQGMALFASSTLKNRLVGIDAGV